MSPNGREVIDVSGLPTTVFGHRGPLWWGTVGFMVVEGTTLAVTTWAYFYLKRNFEQWPPLGAPAADPLPGTVGLAILLAMIPVMARADRHAHRLDAAATVRWLWIAALLGAAANVCRALELEAIGVRWDSSAYGSLLWLLLGFHATLLLVDVGETLALVALLRSRHRQLNHFADVSDAALYQYFLSLVWVPLYVVIYLLPRLGP